MGTYNLVNMPGRSVQRLAAVVHHLRENRVLSARVGEEPR